MILMHNLPALTKILVTCLLLLNFYPSVQAQDRPNIIWITVEDMSPNLGCYGDIYAHTPHLDRFAEESILYTNAIATAPACRAGAGRDRRKSPCCYSNSAVGDG